MRAALRMLLTALYDLVTPWRSLVPNGPRQDSNRAGKPVCWTEDERLTPGYDADGLPDRREMLDAHGFIDPRTWAMVRQWAARHPADPEIKAALQPDPWDGWRPVSNPSQEPPRNEYVRFDPKAWQEAWRVRKVRKGGAMRRGKPKREWWHVVPETTECGRRWVVMRTDGPASSSCRSRAKRRLYLVRKDRKVDAVAYARRVGRRRWKVDGIPVQLVLHGVDGKIKRDATYGRDPRPPKGSKG